MFFRIPTFLVFLAVVGGLNTARSNADIVFVLDDTVGAFSDGLNNGDVVSVGGVDLTFSNLVVANGSTHGTVEGVGILMSSTTEPGLTDVISFNFSFSETVQLLTYDIGTHEDTPSGSFFTISGPNGISGNNTIPSGTSFTESTHNFNPGTISSFQAGQVYSFTHNLPSSGDPLFNLEEFKVTTVPEPGSACLISVGIFAFAYRRNRGCV